MHNETSQPFKRMRHIADRVALHGTDKQIKWATSLRKKIVKDLEDGKPRMAFLALKGILTEDDCQEMGCTTVEQISSLCSGCIIHLLQEGSAKWWIDNKDLPAHVLFAIKAKEKIEEYKETQPFR